MIDKRKKTTKRMCESKKSFYSTQSAARAAANIRRSGGPVMRWYECPHCGKWHFTSQTVKQNESRH